MARLSTLDKIPAEQRSISSRERLQKDLKEQIKAFRKAGGKITQAKGCAFLSDRTTVKVDGGLVAV